MMETVVLLNGLRCRRWLLFCFTIAITSQLCFMLPVSSHNVATRKALKDVNASKPAVRVHTNHKYVVIDNGIVKVTFAHPQGFLVGIEYGGLENVLEAHNAEKNRGYWDIVCGKGCLDGLVGTEFRIVAHSEEQVEISFYRPWNASTYPTGHIPLNVDKRFIVRRGSSGVYFYAVMERGEGFPESYMGQIRTAFKLNMHKFHYMAISDEMQRIMPTAEDRSRGESLAYKEAVLLTDPANKSLKNQVDDKYMYSLEDKDIKVHGWISSKPAVGFWLITASNEFRVAGPFKQDLTSHVGPTSLSMFVANHYVGKDLNAKFKEGERWKKVMGPVFLYLNSLPTAVGQIYAPLWKDAKRQMEEEVNSWPYSFLESKDFQKAGARGLVKGQLFVHDWNRKIPADDAYVGLAAPGDVGSWQTETKGYQFWTQADKDGRFRINKVTSGTYNLYAYVPGVIGDYKLDTNITVNSGSENDVGLLTFNPPRTGPTLWEIGVPDRSAGEFFIPNPYPTRANPLFLKLRKERYRQYGLWEEYPVKYPNHDLIYKVGESKYNKDWFYAHVTRLVGHDPVTGKYKYNATTWQIIFPLSNVESNGNYTLRVALAAATVAVLEVRVNNLGTRPLFSTGRIGWDNAIARHGIHGLYRLYNIDVPGSLLHKGDNTIFLTQRISYNSFNGLMYDYLRLEALPLLNLH